MEQYVAVRRTWLDDGSITAEEIVRGTRDDCRIAAIHQSQFVPSPHKIGTAKVERALMRVMPAIDFDSNPVRW